MILPFPVQDFPEPMTFNVFQSFLWFIGCFRKFIPAYESITRLLRDLLRDSVLFWTITKRIVLYAEVITYLNPVLNIFSPGSKLEVRAYDSKLKQPGKQMKHIDASNGILCYIYHSWWINW